MSSRVVTVVAKVGQFAVWYLLALFVLATLVLPVDEWSW